MGARAHPGRRQHRSAVRGATPQRRRDCSVSPYEDSDRDSDRKISTHGWVASWHTGQGWGGGLVRRLELQDPISQHDLVVWPGEPKRRHLLRTAAQQCWRTNYGADGLGVFVPPTPAERGGGEGGGGGGERDRERVRNAPGTRQSLNTFCQFHHYGLISSILFSFEKPLFASVIVIPLPPFPISSVSATLLNKILT